METIARQFLADYCKRCLEKSPCPDMSKMARAAGMAPSTLNRFLKDPLNAGTAMLRTDTLLKLYAHSGVPIFSGFEEVAWALGGDATAQEERAINGRKPVRPIRNVSAKAG